MARALLVWMGALRRIPGLCLVLTVVGIVRCRGSIELGVETYYGSQYGIQGRICPGGPLTNVLKFFRGFEIGVEVYGRGIARCRRWRRECELGFLQFAIPWSESELWAGIRRVFLMLRSGVGQ